MNGGWGISYVIALRWMPLDLTDDKSTLVQVMAWRNGRYNADDIFKCIFLKENVWILTVISMKFVVRVQLTILQHLVQIMAWRRPGDKPLSEPMMVSLLTHICLTRPQWVNGWILMFANFHYELITGVVVCKWKPSTFSLSFTAYQMISSRTVMFHII